MTKSSEVDNNYDGYIFIDESGDVQPIYEEKSQPHPVRPEDMPHESSSVNVSKGRVAVRKFVEEHSSDRAVTADMRSALPAYRSYTYTNRKN